MGVSNEEVAFMDMIETCARRKRACEYIFGNSGGSLLRIHTAWTQLESIQNGLRSRS